MAKARNRMISQCDFINSISQMDDIQHVSTRTVNGQVNL